MKPIQLGAECAMLLLQIMQLNAETKEGESYNFCFLGSINAIEIQKHNDDAKRVQSMTHYIGEDYGCTLEKLFEFVDKERDITLYENAKDDRESRCGHEEV